MSHYYEAHVTIEPVFEESLAFLTSIAEVSDFKPAKLLMQKRAEATPERSDKDTFITAHSQDFMDLYSRTKQVVTTLQSHGFKVWRYKIESAIIDSRSYDCWELLS